RQPRPCVDLNAVNNEYAKPEQGNQQFNRRINRRDGCAAASTSSLETSQVADNRDIVIPIDLCSARRAVRPRENNGLAQRQPVDDYVEKASEEQAKDKNNRADKERREIFHKSE